MPEIDTAVTICYMAWDTGNSAGKTGDNGNHTLKIISDGTAATPTNSPSEIDATNTPGMYKITITAGENDGNVMALAGKSSTSDIVIIPVTWTNKVNVTQIEGSDATNQIADAVLIRGVSNVEDTADATSLAALVLAAFESVISGTTWTIYKTDHSTTFTTRTVTTDSSAAPIVEVT